MIQRFNDPAAMAKIRGEMIENLRRRGGAESILLTSVDRDWTGKRLSELAEAWKIEPIDAAVRILRANVRDSIASSNIIHSDVDLVMKQPWVSPVWTVTMVIPANTPPFRGSTRSMCRSGMSST